MTARGARRSRPAAGLAAALLLTVAGCGGGGGPSEPQTRLGRPVLFVGNSLTYTHDLPLVVEALADSAGAPPLAVAMIAGPDAALSDHWDATGVTAARPTIARGGWEVVVLQQGPSSRDDSRALLRDYVGRFAAEIHAAGGAPALYQVWPAAPNQADFPRALESYALAADDVDGLLLPVGEAWLAAWRRDPDLPLYAADGLHQSPAGTYLAALTIVAQLTGRSPIGLPAVVRTRRGATLTVPPAVATLLQEAAAEAVAAANAPSASRR
jgi:hypothetical protein